MSIIPPKEKTRIMQTLMLIVSAILFLIGIGYGIIQAWR